MKIEMRNRLPAACLAILLMLLLSVLAVPALAWTPATRAELAELCFMQMPQEWQVQLKGGLAQIKQAAAKASFAAVKDVSPDDYDTRTDYVAAVLSSQYDKLVATALNQAEPEQGLQALGTLAGLCAEAFMPATYAKAVSPDKAGEVAQWHTAYAADVEKLLPDLKLDFGQLIPQPPRRMQEELVWAASFQDVVDYGYESGLRIAVLRSITKALILKACTRTVEAWLAALEEASRGLQQEYSLVKAATERGNLAFYKHKQLFFPLRPVANFAGYAVVWSADEGLAYLLGEASWAAIKPDDRHITVDGKRKKLKASPELSKRGLLVPDQFVEDYLGLKITFRPSSPLVLLENLDAGKRELFAVEAPKGEQGRGWFWWWPF